MALTAEKIMKIIEENDHITVKRGNRPLFKKLQKLESQGKVEFADTYRDCDYYRKAGSDWRFFSEEERISKGID